MDVAKETVTELEKQFRRIAVCGFCRRTFSKPQILPCFHSFCLHCLNDNTTWNLQSGSTLNCPTCRIDFLIPKEGVATLLTNEYIDRIIATANALSPILGIDLSSFQHTDGFASPRAATDSYDCRHDYGRQKSTTQIIVHSANSRDKYDRVCPEESRQSYQWMSYCQMHWKKFENYCSDCIQVMCPLCNESGHRDHQVISIALATTDLRHMMDNYFIGIESCHAYYRAQSETAREGRTASATMNRMDSTPVRLDSRGNFISGRCTQLLPASPLSNASLDTWKGYTRRFYEAITTRRLGSDILNISKKLLKLQVTWHQVYEQDRAVQQSQSKNFPCSRVHALTRKKENRRELEGKEKCIQISLWEQMEWVANEKWLRDVIKMQSDEKCWVEAHPNEQLKKCLHLKTERDSLPGELQLVKEISKPNMGDTKSSMPKVSPHNQTRHESSVIEQLHAANEQQKLKLLHQIKEREEYYMKEKAIWDKNEKQFKENIKRLESQACTINMEKEYFATLYENEKKSHERSTSQFSEHFKQNFEWVHMQELCNDSLKQLKSEKDKLEGELREQQKSKADMQNMLTEQVQNKNRLRSDLEQLKSWIEETDIQPGDFQMTKESGSENGIIEKLRASIIKKIKDSSEKERILLDRNKELNHHMEELKSRASIEQMTQQRNCYSSSVAVKEDEWSVRVEQYDDIIKKLEDRLTVEQLQNEKRLDHELEQLISWIERFDTLSAEFQITTRGDSDNGMIEKLQVSIVKKIEEFSGKERLLLNKIEDLSHQMEEMKSRASSNLMVHQLKSIDVAKKERASLIREKQDADQIKELEHQIDRLKENLTQQHESNRTSHGKSEATLRMESHLTDELTESMQRLGLADKKQEDDIGLLRDLENLIKWIERGGRQLTEDQMTTEGESVSENSIIEKLRASIVKETRERSEKERFLLDRNEELNHQVEELKSRASIEQMAQNSDVAEKERKCVIREKQFADQIQELDSQIDQLKGDVAQQQESNRQLEVALRRESHLNAELTDLKQRLGLADKKQEDDIRLLRDLENLIKWIERRDTQPTEEDQMMAEGQSENSIIKKIKASIIETTAELINKETQLFQTIEESNHQIIVLRQRLATEEANQRKFDKEFTSERDKLMQYIQLLKNGEKQLNARVQELEHQVTELQQSLTSEQKMHKASLRNSDANLHKQLREKDRILVNDEIHDLQNEILQLREVLRQQEEQKKSSRKELAQVATGKAILVTDMTDSKQKHLNIKNTYDYSTAVQIAASRKPTLPTGISNVGNTCYFGATMQNLVYTFLLSEELHFNPSKQSPTEDEQLVTNAYVEFIPKYYEANCDQTFRHMYMEFCKKSSRFSDRGQHDSHDLFVNFLNCLRDEERRSLGSVNSPGFRNVLTAVDKVFGGHTITVYVCSTCKTPYHVCEPFLDISVPILGPTDGREDEEEDLFINHLHNAQSIGDHDSVRQAVEVTMRPLGARSRLKTPRRIFEERSLMPESMGEMSLNQCLVYYSRTERIHNEYLCSPCEAAERPSMSSALKRTLIYNPPAVLVLHLKRFEQTTVGFKKCNQHVTYDEYLDVGPYCSSSCLRMREPDEANIWYSLYGVVVHKGSLTSGHYVAYIKAKYCDMRQAKQFMQQTFLNREQVLNEDDIRRINASRGMARSRKEWEPREVEGQWYLADDEYVKAVEKTEALSQEAYLLFYERVAK